MLATIVLECKPIVYSCTFTLKLAIRFYAVYDELYSAVMSAEEITPQKYLVEGYPTLFEFPAKQKVKGAGEQDEEFKDEL